MYVSVRTIIRNAAMVEMLTSIFLSYKISKSRRLLLFFNSKRSTFSFSLKGKTKQTLHLGLKHINQKRNVELFMTCLKLVNGDQDLAVQ